MRGGWKPVRRGLRELGRYQRRSDGFHAYAGKLLISQRRIGVFPTAEEAETAVRDHHASNGDGGDDRD
jgi:hypothetical protein